RNLFKTVPQPDSMAWFEARRRRAEPSGRTVQNSPVDPRDARNASEIAGVCVAEPTVRIHLPPAVSPQTIGSAGGWRGVRRPSVDIHHYRSTPHLAGDRPPGSLRLCLRAVNKMGRCGFLEYS